MKIHDHADDFVLCNSCEGTWDVATSSGSTYRFDMDARTVVRLRADVSLDANFDATDMRRDGEPLPFKALGPVKVGNHAVIEMTPLFQSDKVEPVATIRITTPVVSVISA